MKITGAGRNGLFGVVCLAVVIATLNAQAEDTIVDGLLVLDDGVFCSGLEITEAVAPTNEQRLYYGFDEAGTNVMDGSGSGNTGIVSGATWTNNGAIEGGYGFDGTDDYIEAADSSSLDIQGAFTISLWVKDWNTNALQALVMKHDDSGGHRAYGLYINWGYITVQVSSDGSAKYEYRTQSPYGSNGEWTHIIATWDGTPNSGGAIYLNDESVSIQTQSSGFSGTNIYNSSQPLRVGAKSDGGWYFDGEIDEVRIYAEELSSSDLTLVYKCGSTNSEVVIDRPTTIYHIVPQGDISMGSYNSEP